MHIEPLPKTPLASNSLASSATMYVYAFYPAMMLALESNNVIDICLRKMASGGVDAMAESRLMVSEKVNRKFGKPKMSALTGRCLLQGRLPGIAAPFSMRQRAFTGDGKLHRKAQQALARLEVKSTIDALVVRANIDGSMTSSHPRASPQLCAKFRRDLSDKSMTTVRQCAKERGRTSLLPMTSAATPVSAATEQNPRLKSG